jgi:hypothetical protein
LRKTSANARVDSLTCSRTAPNRTASISCRTALLAGSREGQTAWSDPLVVCARRPSVASVVAGWLQPWSCDRKAWPSVESGPERSMSDMYASFPAWSRRTAPDARQYFICHTTVPLRSIATPMAPGRHRWIPSTGEEPWIIAHQATTDERIPVGRLSAYLWPRRSRATCRNGGPHSGYRHLADKDEAGGSSPPRPTPFLTSANAGHCRRSPPDGECAGSRPLT